MSKKHKPMTGAQGAFKRDGFGGVWKWALGHGIKRWLKARNWARRKRHSLKDPSGFKKAELAYSKKIAWFRAHKHHAHHVGKNVVMFDGKPFPAWIASIAKKARASGMWNGEGLSGVRTVAESIALCEHMCGQPACPGTCAGAATNHTCPPDHTCAPHEGAGDFTDPEGLEAYCRSHNEPLYGAGYALPSDINHFSGTGR
jgi:hypothetical protein